METNTSIKYFRGLNALRFIAASLVIFHHVEQYKFWKGMPNDWGAPMVDSMGHKSVSFFFVLSGFLITYLLLCEREKKGFIHLGKFYMRRALRIWPLYFLIVVVALFAVPLFASGVIEIPSYGWPVMMSFLFFMPNLLRVIMPRVIGANQLWSVGIEEQFYLIWPVLVGLFAKRILPFLLSFIALKFMINAGAVASLDYLGNSQYLVRMNQFLQLYELFPVEQMAVGGLGAAFIFLRKNQILKVIYHPISLILCLDIIAYFAISDIHVPYETYLDAILFIIIIMNICHHRFLNKFLEFKFFRHLGNISYGIYMWHTIVIVVLLKVIDLAQITEGLNIILYLGSFIITLLVAHLSYQYFEKPFLKFKKNFSFDKVKLSSEVT